MRPLARPATVVALAAALLAGTACGTDTAPPVESATGPTEPPGPGAWTHQELATAPGADREILVAGRGDQVTVLVTTGDDVVTSWTAGADGTFVAGEPLPVDGGEEGMLRLTALVGTDDGWLALGSVGKDFTLTAFASEDGLSWQQTAADGFTTPGEVHDLIATDDGLVAVGALRPGPDPGQGPFAAAAWRSGDGQVWEEIPLPRGDAAIGAYDPSYAGGLVDTGSELLAAGALGRAGALWSSTDEGATWDRVERPGLERAVELRDVERAGDVLVAGALVAVGDDPVATDQGFESRPTLFRSDDGGRTWEEADPPGGPHAEPFPPTVSVAGGRFLVLVPSFIEAWRSPEVCYAAIERCRQDSTTTLYQSADGRTWTPVDTGDLDLDEHQDVDGTFGDASGRVLALSGGPDHVDTWAWSAGVPLPTGVAPTAPEADVTLLAEGARPEPGVRYAVPLFIHCGMDWLHLGGEPWQRSDDGPDVETGAGDGGPADWPLAQQTIFGFATVVSDDVVEYSIGDGEVIATYRPATEEPPGCD